MECSAKNSYNVDQGFNTMAKNMYYKYIKF